MPRRSWTRPLALVALTLVALTSIPLIASAVELPAPSLSRSATPDGGLVAGETVRIDLTARNAGYGTAYDPWVVECVGAGLVVSAVQPTTTVTPGGCADGGTRITWTLDDLAPQATTPLSYSATSSAVLVAGTVFQTRGRISVLSAPYDRPTAEAAVPQGISVRSIESARPLTYGLPGVSAVVAPGNPETGDVLTFTLRSVVPADVNLSNAVVRDLVPVGLDLDRLETVSVTCADGGAACPLHDTATRHHINHQRLVTWSLGHLRPATTDRVITVVFTIPVVAGPNTVLRNRSGMQWSGSPLLVGGAGFRGGAVVDTLIPIGGPVVPTDPSPTDPSVTGPSSPGTSQPGTSLPGTSEPGTSQPGTSQPATSQPGTSQPGGSTTGNSSDPGTSGPGTTGASTSTPTDDDPDAAGTSTSDDPLRTTPGAGTTTGPAPGGAAGSPTGLGVAGGSGVGGNTGAGGGSTTSLAWTGLDLRPQALLGLLLLLAGLGLTGVGLRTRRSTQH